MRYSLAIFAAVAAAAPQVQPISQISDGQIQAPPATASAPAATVALSSVVVPVASTSVVAPVPAVPSVAPPVCKFNHIDA
jgi:hypothetical protein